MALNGKTGKLKWRFLAARNERRIVAYGQVESAWPVPNVEIINGTLYAAAGRIAELDGGIEVWGLDASNGTIKNKFTMFTPADHYSGKKGVDAKSEGPRGMILHTLGESGGKPTILYRNLAGRGGLGKDRSVLLDPNAYNGKTIDYRTSAVVTVGIHSQAKPIVGNAPRLGTSAAMDHSSGQIWVENPNGSKIVISIIREDGRSILEKKYSEKNITANINELVSFSGQLSVVVKSGQATIATWQYRAQ